MNRAIVPVSSDNTLPVPVTRSEPVRAEPRDGRDGIDLTDLWRILRRRYLSIFITAEIVAAALFAFTLSQPPRYTAIATAGVRAVQNDVLGGRQSNVRDQALDSAAIDTELEVMRSSRVIDALIDELDLMGHPAWIDLRAAIEEPGSDASTVTQAGVAATPITGNSAAVRGWLSDTIRIRRAGVTYAIEIAATARDPDLAALVANSFYKIYSKVRADIRQQEARGRNSWLGDRIAVLRDDVFMKEAAVDKYRASAGLLSSGGGSLAEQVLAGAQSSVAEAQADLAAKQARLDQVQSLVDDTGGARPNAAELTNVLNSQVIRELRARAADVARRKAEMGEVYGRKHPAFRSVIAEERQVRSDIQGEMDRIVSNLEGEVEIARLRLASLNEQLDEAMTRVVTSNQAEVRLRDLEREASAARDVYERYLERHQLAVDEEQLSDAGVYLISPARAPDDPTWPNTKLALALSLGLGLIAGAGVGGFLELRDNTIRCVDEVERHSNYLCVAALPHLNRRKLRKLQSERERNPAGFLVENPLSAYAESVRVLDAALTNHDDPIRVVAVTSALPNEGKTSTSLSLARSAANSGQSVVLVDCDERRRGVSKTFQTVETPGLLEVLTGEADLADAILTDPGGTPAHILPFKMAGWEGFESQNKLIGIFGVGSFDDFVDNLQARYDLVILDCAPILAVAETRNLVRLAQTTLMVARSRKTPSPALQSAIRQVETAGGSVFGIVLNDVSMASPGSSSFSDPIYYGEYMKHYHKA
ncbi:MAG: GumC family protein [Alphaproteobacteria bacterium]